MKDSPGLFYDHNSFISQTIWSLRLEWVNLIAMWECSRNAYPWNIDINCQHA